MKSNHASNKVTHHAMRTIISIGIVIIAEVCLADPPKIPSPQKTGNLCARMSVNEAMPANYRTFVNKNERLITDLSYGYYGTSIKDFYEARAKLKAACPKALIGCYLSSRAVGSRGRSQPSWTLPAELFNETELLSKEFIQDDPPLRIVDYRQPNARHKLIQYIADQLESYDCNLAFLDNVSHNSSWEGFIDWRDTAVYLRELTSELHRRNIAVIYNVAIRFDVAPLADVNLLGKIADGVSLEMHDDSTAEKVDANLKAHSALAKNGCKAILVPAQDQSDAEQLAQFAMIVGDCYVISPFFLPTPAWASWPADFGIARGQVQINDQSVSRKFQKGTVSVGVSVAEKSAGGDLPEPDSKATDCDLRSADDHAARP